MDPIVTTSRLRGLPELNRLSGPEPLGRKSLNDLEAQKVTGGKSFSDILTDSIGEVSRLERSADESIKQIATGESGNIHETLIEVQKAELSMRMLLEVRKKVLGAYEEIMRTQI